MQAILQKNALDLGVVTANPAAMLGFYRDILGFAEDPQVTIPGLGTIHKLRCGDSLIKMLVPLRPPAPYSAASAAASNPDPMRFATLAGFRYCTLTIANLAPILARCREAGLVVLADAAEIRPGVTAAMLEDPDGNAVELMQLRMDG